MRHSSEYRAARRNEAKAAGFPWRFLDMVVDATGARKIAYPFGRGGNPAKLDALLAAKQNAITQVPGEPPDDGSRFGFAELTRLRAERGVGPVSRISAEKRATFVPTKRK